MTWFRVFRCAHVLNVGAICARHVGQTLQAEPISLISSVCWCRARSLWGHVRTGGKVRWSVLWETTMSVRPSSRTKKLVPFCIIMHVCIQVLLSSGCQQQFYISFSCVVDFYCRHCVCARFHCNQRPFPISQSYSLLFHFSNAWYHCFPSSETYFNDEFSSSTRCCRQLELHPTNAAVSCCCLPPTAVWHVHIVLQRGLEIIQNSGV